MKFPDVERALGTLVQQLVASADHVGSQTPPDLAARLPFIRVNRYGGTRDRVSDTASIDVETFASNANRSVAFDLLSDALDLIENTRSAGGVLLDDFSVSAGISERPWPGAPLRRFGASITVTARRQ